MKTTEEEAQAMLYGDNDDFEIILDELEELDRWSATSRLIVRQMSTDKFFETYYSQGATEQQDQAPFEYAGTVTWNEVAPVEEMCLVYRPIPKEQ
ncbi:MAG: hypothetical protein KOO63_07930 [Bacteroidales bacterium]|nr:hypothetical protein [Candidatus Latescibacterota bacterium]